MKRRILIMSKDRELCYVKKINKKLTQLENDGIRVELILTEIPTGDLLMVAEDTESALAAIGYTLMNLIDMSEISLEDLEKIISEAMRKKGYLG